MSKNIKKSLALLTIAFFMFGFFVATPTADAVFSCSTSPVGTPLVNVTQNITNDPDSGSFGGNWALDNFTRHIQIWQETEVTLDDHYCARADDVGTFTSFGGVDGKSPADGAALSEVVTGTMTGSTHGEIIGGTFSSSPDVDASVDCDTNAGLCSSGLTSYWVQNYFGGSADYDYDWGWTYNGGANGTWINAESGNTGNITIAPLSTVYVNGSTGNDSNVGSQGSPFATIQAAMSAVAANGTVKIAPGNYNIVKDDITQIEGQTGWYLPITKNNITLMGVDSSGNEITDASDTAAYIYSTQDTANGAWASQNLITVFSDNVTIKGLVIMNKISPNKGIEVVGNNFKAENNLFAPLSASLFPDVADYHDSTDNSDQNDISKYGSGVYFNNNSATAARTGTVTNNIFKNSGVTFDSFGDNWTVNVTNNVFDGNRVWSWTDIDGLQSQYYSSVGATTWANQPDFTDSVINITDNKFINMVSGEVLVKTKDGMTGSFNATKNWWGKETGPVVGTGGDIQGPGTVTFTPWYVNSGMTILSDEVSGGTVTPTGSDDLELTSDTNGEADLPSGVTQIVLDNDSNLNLFAGLDNDAVTINSGTPGTPIVLTNSSLPGMSVSIPDGTEITGPSGWDGIITPPVTGTSAGNAPAGFSVGGTVITVGSPDGTLEFDKAVQLTLVGVNGAVGYKPSGSSNWVAITTSCNSATDHSNISSGECYFTSGSDTVIWTYHFTSFGELNTNSTGGSSGSSHKISGSSSNSVSSSSEKPEGQVLGASTGPIEGCVGTVGFSPVTGESCATNSTVAVTTSNSSATTAGQVLGADKFSFSLFLKKGSTSNEVMELQKLLNAKGYGTLVVDGKFGPMTHAAVVKFQLANGLVGDGVVGPLTRAALNK